MHAELMSSSKHKVCTLSKPIAELVSQEQTMNTYNIIFKGKITQGYYLNKLSPVLISSLNISEDKDNLLFATNFDLIQVDTQGFLT